MTSEEFQKLSPEIRDAALRGLSGADDEIGIPDTPEAVLSDVKSGQEVKALLGAISTATISDNAKTAPGANEHNELGPYPDDPTYIR